MRVSQAFFVDPGAFTTLLLAHSLSSGSGVSVKLGAGAALGVGAAEGFAEAAAVEAEGALAGADDAPELEAEAAGPASLPQARRNRRLSSGVLKVRMVEAP
jgi:hypothetical protein